MSNHDVVLCRSFGNEPLVRVVWSITEEGILICGQDSLDLSKQTQSDAVPVLAPFEAIYGVPAKRSMAFVRIEAESGML